MESINYLFGTLGTLLTLLFLMPLFRFWRKPKLEKRKAKWLIIAIIGAVIVPVISSLRLETKASDIAIPYYILFSIIFAPILEEIVYRHMILGGVLKNIIYFGQLKRYLFFAYISIVLLLPSWGLYSLGLTVNKPLYYLPLFVFVIPASYQFLTLFNSKKTFVIFAYLTIGIQALLFSLSHHPNASTSHIISGIFFGFLYHKSKNLTIPIIAHVITNIMILILAHV